MKHIYYILMYSDQIILFSCRHYKDKCRLLWGNIKKKLGWAETAELPISQLGNPPYKLVFKGKVLLAMKYAK